MVKGGAGSGRSGASLTTALGELERQLQLVLPVALEHVRYGVADEPGERDAVFIGQRNELLVVPFVDTDRDPCPKLRFVPPGSHRRLVLPSSASL
jgi:hypothetical protein